MKGIKRSDVTKAQKLSHDLRAHLDKMIAEAEVFEYYQPDSWHETERAEFFRSVLATLEECRVKAESIEEDLGEAYEE